jgi:hypothetical protein
MKPSGTLAAGFVLAAATLGLADPAHAGGPPNGGDGGDGGGAGAAAPSHCSDADLTITNGPWSRLAQCAAWSCPSRTRRQTRACSSDTPTQTWSLPPAVCWFIANADVESYAADTTTGNACPREGTLVVTAPNDSVSHTLPVALPICSATISSID